MSTSATSASCLCGAVRWEAEGPFELMSHCHCSRCRKAHGAPYATYLMVKEERFRIIEGREKIARWQAGPDRLGYPFCSVCGSVVPDGEVSKRRVGMPAGNFDGDPEATPLAHIFVASKAPWVSIHDELPRYDAYPPEYGIGSHPDRAPLDPEGLGTRGSCLCGAVSFVVTGEPLRSRTCHCSRCRKAGSAAHVSYLVVAHDGVRFTRGEDHVEVFKLPDARFFKHAFCRTCGSSMPRRDAERGIAIVPMGSLDDDPAFRPQSHIFVASKAAWDVIADALPCWEEAPP
jgi:hypothetical protein